MVFTSVNFVLFFSIVAILYYVVPGKFQWIWLLISGLFFYMYGNPTQVFLPLFIILITYFSGIEIEKANTSSKARKFYLVSIILIVGLLVFFKYSNFFTSLGFDLFNFSRRTLFGESEIINNSLLVKVIVPLGISYITFQAIGYLIEIKRGNHAAEKNLGHFATYLLFFPKIIAGPIERAHNFLPQLKQTKIFNNENISAGLKLIIWGFFKKIVIANRLSLYVTSVLGKSEDFLGVPIFLAVIFYVFQMYADFSGYTDMARGFAKILGYDLMENFNLPLFSKSVTEFWRKWHISLSTWFADYFYSPLVIAKRDWGKWSVVYAFSITFIVLGFWHGANWTFIVFGALHALILTIEFFTRKIRKNIRKLIPGFVNSIAGIVFTIGYFAFSLIFFRANSVSEALTIIHKIGIGKGSIFIESDPSSLIYSFIGILILMLVEFKLAYYTGNFSFFNNRHWLIRNLSFAVLVIIILLIGVFDGGQFIYVQF
jgi:alginate O-acetyltransferase complex protein AlgI